MIDKKGNKYMPKVSFHNGIVKGKKVGSTQHNDRTKTENARNIDRDRSALNVYYANGKYITHEEIQSGVTNLEQEELAFYRERYSAGINAQNERNNKSRHSERNKTVEQVYENSRTKPYEFILQIGNVDEPSGLDYDTTKELFEKQIKTMQEKYPNIQVVSYSIHWDEVTPHTHLDVVFESVKNGLPVINQTQALKDMGFTNPNPNEKTSRYNNPLISWTEECRQTLIAIANEYQEIDSVPLPNSKYHKEQEDLIRDKYKSLVEQNKIMEEELTLAHQTLDFMWDKIEFVKQIVPVLQNIYKKVCDNIKDLVNNYDLKTLTADFGLPIQKDYKNLVETKEVIEETFEEHNIPLEDDEWDIEI